MYMYLDTGLACETSAEAQQQAYTPLPVGHNTPVLDQSRHLNSTNSDIVLFDKSLQCSQRQDVPACLLP